MSLKTTTSTSKPELPAVDQRLYKALRDDIAQRGILVPLVYDAKTKRCVDGQVRLKVAEELGIKNIPKIYIGNLTTNEGDDLRLILNGIRRQLTRDQLATIITWLLRKNPLDSDREIGRRTGADHKTIGRARQRLESSGEIPQSPKRLGADGRVRPSARKPMVFTARTATANEATKALDALGDSAPAGVSSLRKLRRLAMERNREDELKKSGPSLPDHFDLRCCDFRSLEVEASSVDCFLLDPPWHSDKHLRKPFAETVVRLLKPGGYALIYTGNQGLLDFGDVMRNAGLTYRWLIACINEGGGGSIRNNGSVFNCYRAVALFQKGGRYKTPGIFSDVLRTEEREKTWHPWQQPISESIAFVKAFTKPGQLVADLTMGSGTVAEAVARVGGGRRFIGCEIRQELVDLAKRRVAEALDS